MRYEPVNFEILVSFSADTMSNLFGDLVKNRLIDLFAPLLVCHKTVFLFSLMASSESAHSLIWGAHQIWGNILAVL